MTQIRPIPTATIDAATLVMLLDWGCSLAALTAGLLPSEQAAIMTRQATDQLPNLLKTRDNILKKLEEAATTLQTAG